LINDETESFFINICRGLFEKDKLLYAFLNASSILRRSGEIGVDEWNFFLRGSNTDFSSNEKDVDYISEAVFYRLLGLEECHINFNNIVHSFKDKSKL
jgi:dynein heavy chain